VRTPGRRLSSEKIDYIYMASKQVLAAQIDHFQDGGKYPSDHFPVVATVKLPDE